MGALIHVTLSLLGGEVLKPFPLVNSYLTAANKFVKKRMWGFGSEKKSHPRLVVKQALLNFH